MSGSGNVEYLFQPSNFLLLILETCVRDFTVVGAGPMDFRRGPEIVAGQFGVIITKPCISWLCNAELEYGWGFNALYKVLHCAVWISSESLCFSHKTNLPP